MTESRSELEAAIAAAAEATVVAGNAALESSLASACNDSQADAVAVAASRRLTLIHGPPGTGKVNARLIYSFILF